MSLEPFFIWSLLAIAAAFVISKEVVPILILLAKERNLYDRPDNFRKIHTCHIPTLGGVAIFAAFLISFSASSYADEIAGFGYFVAASVLIFATGIKDDLIGISPVKKLAAQFAAAGLMIFGSGLYFHSLGGVFGIEAIPVWIGIPLTFFTIITVINAYNLVDGIDSLAGGIGVIAAAFFGYWFFEAGYYELAVFSGVLITSILGFLWHNRPPAKIFMGDTGSMLIGFYLSFLVISFVNLSITSPTVIQWQPAAPVIAVAVLMIPLYDTFRVFTLRTLRGKSPFAPDRSHVHHHLLDAGFSHGQASIFLFLVNILVIGTAILLSQYLSNTGVLFSILGLSMVFFPTNRWKRKTLRYLTLKKSSAEEEWIIHDEKPNEYVLAELRREKYEEDSDVHENDEELELV